MNVSLCICSLFLIDERIFDHLADFALILVNPLFEVLVLFLWIRGEIAHNKLLLELFIKPGVDHGLAAADINLSEILEVLDELVLQVADDVLRLGVLGKPPQGVVYPGEDFLLEVDVHLVDLVRVDEVSACFEHENSEVDHLGLSDLEITWELVNILTGESF